MLMFLTDIYRPVMLHTMTEHRFHHCHFCAAADDDDYGDVVVAAAAKHFAAGCYDAVDAAVAAAAVA